MKITDFLQRPSILVPLAGADKCQVITELVDLLAEQKSLTNRDTVLQAILAREKIRSTGVGEGLAVPHAKCDGVGRLVVAVGKPASPMEFDSADGRPCRMVVLIAGPRESTGPHLQALAAISRLWLNRNFREAACGALSADELFGVFSTYDT